MSALLGALSARFVQSVRSTANGIFSRASTSTTPTSSTCFASAGAFQQRFVSSSNKAAAKAAGGEGSKASKVKGHAFPQFADLPPVHRIAGQGNAYVTKVERKRVLVDPNVPNFDHIEPLKWTTWRMLRDVRRRTLFTRYFFKRTALYNTRKCGLLPSFVREAAKEEELRLPRDSMFHMMHIRCAVSGRSRGLLKKYRLSRLVWRNLADNNKLSGVIKASW